MANQLQLQRQIQEEIDKEAKIECRIEFIVKKFLKRNKQFYRVPELNGCDAVLFYFKDDLTRFYINLFKKESKSFKKLHESKEIIFVYLKNKNSRDVKSNTRGFIRTGIPAKSFW